MVTLGMAGSNIGTVLAPWFDSLPPTPYSKLDSASGSLIRVADANGVARYLWIAPVDTAQNAWPELTKSLAPRASSVWRLGDIEAGLPRILKATQEQFVPQMVNFELIGGVNFKKGCYPGQEIVA